MEPKQAERSIKKNNIKYIFKKYFKKSEAVYQLHGSVMFRWTFCSASHHSCVFIQQWIWMEPSCADYSLSWWR